MTASIAASLYISPAGNDAWSGTLAAPNPEGTDGPLATIRRAQGLLREKKAKGDLWGAVDVLLRGGRYPITRTLTFTPEDSWPTTYASYPGETAIIDGGRRIEGWRAETRDGHEIWVADLKDVAEGRWYFRQLWVNGERRHRTRVPDEGYYEIAGLPDHHSFRPDYWGADGSFYVRPGDVQPWENITDVDIVVLHRWDDERLPIASFDAETNLVRSSRDAIFELRNHEGGCAPYFIENVKEALRPGRWYLDRHSGELVYLPLPGEQLESSEVYAPVVDKLVRMEGVPDEERFVEHIHFIGLGFEHTSWYQPPGGGERWAPLFKEGDYGNAPQGACNIEGAISLYGTRHCSVEDCTLAHIGFYGVELTHGCQYNRVLGNTITDLGAGGIKSESLGLPNTEVPPLRRTGYNRFTDNHIYDGGHVFHAALGIHSMDCCGQVIAHNHVHHFDYSGINCGWTWGYTEHVGRDNRIEKNHVHHIGRGVLSDMGAIYLLGVQPGTVVRGNIVHDVEKREWGGRGIYLDEGSSHIVVENNISYNVDSIPLYCHYGRENIIRNNIFAFGREAQLSLSRAEDHIAFTAERNILITDGMPSIYGRAGWSVEKRAVKLDLNLYWDVGGKPIRHGNGPQEAMTPSYDMAGWQRLGYDIHSIVADPRCRDLANFDFALADDSPAFALGFEPIDTSDVGPRPVASREDAATLQPYREG